MPLPQFACDGDNSCRGGSGSGEDGARVGNVGGGGADDCHEEFDFEEDLEGFDSNAGAGSMPVLPPMDPAQYRRELEMTAAQASQTRSTSSRSLRSSTVSFDQLYRSTASGSSHKPPVESAASSQTREGGNEGPAAAAADAHHHESTISPFPGALRLGPVPAASSRHRASIAQRRTDLVTSPRSALPAPEFTEEKEQLPSEQHCDEEH
jgi:hypothetical protein